MKELKEVIPVGRKNKLTKRQIIKRAGYKSENFFNYKLAQLKEKEIVLVDENGYYFPDSKQEYIDFIKDIHEKIKRYREIESIALVKLKQMIK